MKVQRNVIFNKTAFILLPVIVSFFSILLLACNNRRSSSTEETSIINNDTIILPNKEDIAIDAADIKGYVIEENIELGLYEEPMCGYHNGFFKVPISADNGHTYYGIIDKTGNTVVPFIYDAISFYQNGIAWVARNWEVGAIDINGEIKIPIGDYNVLDNFENFRKEGITFARRNDIIYLIDWFGNVICKTDFDKSPESFLNGLAVVSKGGKYGFCDKRGETVVPIVYDHANNFSNGLARVEKGGKVAYIDYEGNIKLSSEYGGGDFIDGITFVYGDGKWALMNKSGKIVGSWHSGIIKERGDFLDGMAWVAIRSESEKKSKYGFIDKNGNVVIPFIYDYARDFHEGIACVVKDRSYGAVDKKGNVVIPFENYWIDYANEGLWMVTNNIITAGYMDVNGRYIIKNMSWGGKFNEGHTIIEYRNERGERRFKIIENPLRNKSK